ncbi:hypothetical protein ANCCAN_04237 [Ancylostoma caninum]|uniref:Uncharacterized protein n=1 Tax=Ancylostoma caninum TaxID=29170 RepID=A0A368H3D5_ANCCA|nr:hypothetical protein ANCCAN_04237 [Ancylostoma caninum]
MCTWSSNSWWDGYVEDAPEDLKKLAEDYLKTKLDDEDILIKFEYTYTDGITYLVLHIGQLKEDIATYVKYIVTKNGPVRPRDISYIEFLTRLYKCARVGPVPAVHDGLAMMELRRAQLGG